MFKGLIDTLFNRKDSKKVEIPDKKDIDRVLSGEIPDNIVVPTITEIRNIQKKEYAASVALQKSVIRNRQHVNELFFLKRYGKIPTKNNWANLPGFMSYMFKGFIVGKGIEDDRVIVFCGMKDVNERKLNNMSIKYNTLIQKNGKVWRGYKWYWVNDTDTLLVILSNAVFVDSISKQWLLDYFDYKEYIEQYRIENPDVMLDLPPRDKIEHEGD